MQTISEHVMFQRRVIYDAVGVPSSDIKLLILSSLYYIERAWTLDDIEEANGISRECNRQFLHVFIQYGSSVLYRKLVLDK